MAEHKHTPHVHAEVIKAWADGKPIEWRRKGDPNWTGLYTPTPVWGDTNEYRVKPEEVVDYTVVHQSGTAGTHFHPSKEKADSFYYSSIYNQGYCKRTTIDGKVVALEFIPR